MRQLATDFAGKKMLDLSDLPVGDGSPIPRISYRDAMETYGSDKPDLRFGMELIELTDVLANTEFGVFKNAECIKAICVKHGASLSRKQIDQFTDIAKSEGAGGLAYITYQDGEAKSPIVYTVSCGTFSCSRDEYASYEDLRGFDIQGSKRQRHKA